MHQKLFHREKQNEMRRFFLDNITSLGSTRNFKKNSIITIEGTDFVAIVTEGKIKQTLYSSQGISKLLYILQPGEIIGELDYFGGGKSDITSIAMTDGSISIVKREELEKALIKNTEIYRYFLYSASRKYRIIMLQMSSMCFNDSLGRIAKAILRLSAQQGKEIGDKIVIDISLTHQDLAELVGCSRVTITRGLNKLKEEKIIDIQKKKIIIKNQDILNSLILE